MIESKPEQLKGNHQFSPGSVAIAELTFFPKWYPGKLSSPGDTDKVRGDLALKSISAGVKKGYHMIISDGGSSASFKEKLTQLTPIILLEREEQTRASGRRQVFLAASAIEGVQVILRTEPEKVSIVEHLVPQLALPIIKKETDIVVAKRNPRLFQQTYPSYMWQSEIAGNLEYNKLLSKHNLLSINQPLDIFFGPAAFRNTKQILSLILERYEFKEKPFLNTKESINSEESSNGFYFPIVAALYQGLKVVSQEVDFRYPKRQKINEETTDKGSIDNFIEKRKRQRQNFLEELKHFTWYLKNDRRSRLKKSE